MSIFTATQCEGIRSWITEARKAQNENGVEGTHDLINTVVFLNWVDENTKTRSPKDTEHKRVQFITDSFNNNTEFGKELKETFYTNFGKHITNVEHLGNNKDHYDLLFTLDDGTTMRCEEKGNSNSTKLSENDSPPWEQSVQRANIPGNQITMCKNFAVLWHDKVVCNKSIRDHLYMISEIPDYETWVKDAFRAGDPKTNYGKELKKNYRIEYGAKSSMNGKKNSPYDYRQDVVPLLEFTEEDKITLINEVQLKLDSVMNEKDCWLQTVGMIPNLKFKWFKHIGSPKIIKVEKKIGTLDTQFIFTTQEETDVLKTFEAILRFGKGTGFTNIRMDIR
jgi:hypothetical protein